MRTAGKGPSVKPDEADTGKPQLPQAEPAVGPDAVFNVPESKDVAPEATVESSSGSNPFSGFFSGLHPHTAFAKWLSVLHDKYLPVQQSTKLPGHCCACIEYSCFLW